MNQANVFKHERLLLWVAMLCPLIALLTLALVNLDKPALPIKKENPNFEQEYRNALTGNLYEWQKLAWENKEKFVSAAIEFFRLEKNCAILKSPGFYVSRIDRFLKENPPAEKQNLLQVLAGVAITEYDFYRGINADEQALQFLGPKMYRENQKARKEKATSIIPRGNGW